MSTNKNKDFSLISNIRFYVCRKLSASSSKTRLDSSYCDQSIDVPFFQRMLKFRDISNLKESKAQEPNMRQHGQLSPTCNSFKMQDIFFVNLV